MANKRKRAKQYRAPSAAAAAPRAAVQAPVRRTQPRRPAAEPRVVVAEVPARPLDRVALLAAGAVSLVAFVVYCLTVEHTVPPGDSGELITDAYVWGVAHPPGYPLYTMLGGVAAHLPGGSPALRMNLMSGLFDALTVGIAFLVVYRLVTAAGVVATRWLPYAAAACGALLLAFSTDFWGYSVVAEVFALNNLLAATLLWLALEWSRRPQRTRLLWAFAFVFGLALCNQLTIVLLIPAFAVLAWQGGRTLLASHGPARPSLRDGAVTLAAFVAGLLPLVYLPIAASRNTAMDWGDATTWGGFKDLILRKDYGTRTLIVGGKHGSIGHNLGIIFSNLATAFVFAGVVLALVGLLWAWRRRRVEGIALLTAFLVSGPIFLMYTNPGYPDALTKGVVARFFILPCIPLAIVAGLGAAWVLERAAALRLARPAAAAIVAAALLAAVPVAEAAVHYSDADQSGVHVADSYGRDVLASLPPRTVLLARGDENYGPVAYLQQVDHLRPDVIVLQTELLKQKRYVAKVRHDHPDLLIPFTQYDGGVRTSLNTFISANIGKRPIFSVGDMEEKDFGKPFDKVLAGLDTQLVPKGTASSTYDATAFSSLHFPHGSYPPSSWEAAIGLDYAQAANNGGVQMQTAEDAARTKLIIELYRESIRLAGPQIPEAYKNLGSMYANGVPPEEAAAALETYLKLRPNDPQDGKIRELIAQLRSQKQ